MTSHVPPDKLVICSSIGCGVGSGDGSVPASGCVREKNKHKLYYSLNNLTKYALYFHVKQHGYKVIHIPSSLSLPLFPDAHHASSVDITGFFLSIPFAAIVLTAILVCKAANCRRLWWRGCRSWNRSGIRRRCRCWIG